MGLFDVHAHLTSSAFEGEVDDVLQRATDAGLTTIVSNGLNIQDNQKVLALAQANPLVRPALGYYPVDAVLTKMLDAGVDYPREERDPHSPDETIQWIGEHLGDAFAIGEIGLDHHWVPEPFWNEQEEIFRKLVALAMDASLPIIIHTRKAEARTLEILLSMGAPRVNWHCFSSRLKLGKRIAEAGHFLSVPANARRSETFTGLLRSVLREQLLLETDCPYLSPEPGTRNEPANVAGTLSYAAEVWQTSDAAALSQLEQNFERLFGCPP